MQIKKTKKYLCVVCGKHEVVESVVEHTFEGDIPDQNNFDLSTYTDHVITGGRLLFIRPAIEWSKTLDAPAVSPGGVCDTCLAHGVVRSLLVHIHFAQ